MVASCAPFPNWSSSYLQLTGCTVEYVVRGNGDPLVLVPGLAGGVELLEPLISRLSRRYRVVACQLRGEGWGFCQTTFGLQQLVADLRSLVETPAGTPGHGRRLVCGAIALEYAARFPGSLSFLAVQGTATPREPLGDVCRANPRSHAASEDNPFISRFSAYRLAIAPSPPIVLTSSSSVAGADQSVMAQRLALLDQYDIGAARRPLSAPTLVRSAANRMWW